MSNSVKSYVLCQCGACKREFSAHRPTDACSKACASKIQDAYDRKPIKK